MADSLSPMEERPIVQVKYLEKSVLNGSLNKRWSSVSHPPSSINHTLVAYLQCLGL